MSSSKKDLEKRVIIHLDLDAFYAQVERKRLGLSNDTPVAVQQHHMLIAVGYAARKFGVQRIQSAAEAKKLCPDLVLAQVEMKDNVVSLERYRNASLEIFAVLKTFKMCKLEKAGTDEAFMDVTEYINERIKNGGKIPEKLMQKTQTTQTTTTTSHTNKNQNPNNDNNIENDQDADEQEIFSQFQDEVEEEEENENPDNENFNDQFQTQNTTNQNTKLSISNNNLNNNNEKLEIAPAEEASLIGHIEGWSVNELFTKDKKLYYGALLAEEIRQKLLTELTFTCSAGISHCKLISKVGSARNKPFQQTVIPSHCSENLLGALAIKKLRGLGGKFGSQVKAMGIETVKQLQEVSLSVLESKFGRETARWLFDYCRGIDYDEIVERDKVRSHGSMTSFRATSDKDFIKERLSSCAEKIADRITVDHQRYNRLPKTLAVHFMSRNEYSRRRSGSRSKSCPMPSNRSAASLLQTALDLLKAAGSIYPLIYIGLVAHNFEDIQSVSLETFFKQIPKGSQKQGESLFKSLQQQSSSTTTTTSTKSNSSNQINSSSHSEKGKLKIEPKKESVLTTPTTSSKASSNNSTTNSPFSMRTNSETNEQQTKQSNTTKKSTSSSSSSKTNSTNTTSPAKKQPIVIDLESDEFNEKNNKNEGKRKNEVGDSNDSNQQQKKQKLVKSSNSNGSGTLLNYFENNNSKNEDFKQLGISETLIKGLNEMQITRPSNIQIKAIPIGLQGFDLIAMSKNGTGKTISFGLILLSILEKAIERRKQRQLEKDQEIEEKQQTLSETQMETIKKKKKSNNNNNNFGLILAPTREIAIQIRLVLSTIAKFLNISIQCFVGGLPLSTDAMLAPSAHIIVGTPGRIIQLFEQGIIHGNEIKFLVLDEADKLLDDSLKSQTVSIVSLLNLNKQTLAFSASMTEQTLNELTKIMKKNVEKILLERTTLYVPTIKQYFVNVDEKKETSKQTNMNTMNTTTTNSYTQSEAIHQMRTFQNKANSLIEILGKISFHQSLVFVNSKSRAEWLAQRLTNEGWPSSAIAGTQDQKSRQSTFEALRNFKIRVLVSTDLTSRGIDVEHVNLVINMELPMDSETYLHRIGRTGRFGNVGVGISIVSGEKEVDVLQNFVSQFGGSIDSLPDEIPTHFYEYSFKTEADKLKMKSFEKIRTDKQNDPKIEEKQEMKLEDFQGTKRKKEKKAKQKEIDNETQNNEQYNDQQQQNLYDPNNYYSNYLAWQQYYHYYNNNNQQNSQFNYSNPQQTQQTQTQTQQQNYPNYFYSQSNNCFCYSCEYERYMNAYKNYYSSNSCCGCCCCQCLENYRNNSFCEMCFK